MPEPAAFRSASAWASTMLHEMAHWTGAEHRLDRKLLTGSRLSHEYAREELRAEMAQAMVCAELGLDDVDFANTAAYLASWLKSLRDDKREIFRAASDAQKIADFLLAFHPDYRAKDAVAADEDAPEPAIAA